MAQDGKPQAFPASFSGAMRILIKFGGQERLVLCSLFCSQSHSFGGASWGLRWGCGGEERGLEGLQRKGKKKPEG